MGKPQDLMLSWLENKSLEKVHDYVGRGRLFRDIPIDQLKDQWARAFKVYAANPHVPGATAESDDFEAELTIRQEPLPMDLVEVEWRQLQNKIDTAMKNLERDPERHKQANEEIVNDLVDFYASIDKTQRN